MGYREIVSMWEYRIQVERVVTALHCAINVEVMPPGTDLPPLSEFCSNGRLTDLWATVMEMAVGT
jgi:hypothetical protein